MLGSKDSIRLFDFNDPISNGGFQLLHISPTPGNDSLLNFTHSGGYICSGIS